MNRMIQKCLMILLTVSMTFFVQNSQLYEVQYESSAGVITSLNETGIIPAGLVSGHRENEIFRPENGRILRRWSRTNKDTYALAGIQTVLSAVNCFSHCEEIYPYSDCFSALFISCGTYDRKLVPRSVPLL